MIAPNLAWRLADRSFRGGADPAGAVSIPFPPLLGNGGDVAELAVTGKIAPTPVS